MLNDKEYSDLVSIIQIAHPENIKQIDDLYNDMQVATIIIYCNKKRFYFQSQTLPKALDKIQHALYSIQEFVI